jgi:hypothetical protein
MTDEQMLPEVSTELTPKAVSEVWNKLSLGPSINVENNWDDKLSVMRHMWDSMRVGVDKYIEQYQVPKEKLENETNAEFSIRVLEHMKTIHKRTRRYCELSENPAVSMELGEGAFNCVFGGQIVARACEQAGIDSFIGLPYGHAGTVIDAGDHSYLFLDVANGEILRLEPYIGEEDFGNVHMGKVAEVLYGREISPYELIPVVSVEESTAISINNLSHLRREALDGDEYAQRVVAFLNLDPDVEYNSAKKGFLPEIAQLADKERWKKEKDSVLEKRNFMLKNWVDTVNKIN